MKRLFSVLLLVGFAVQGLATGAAATGEHPCKALEAACEAAGFHKGGSKEGKGLFVNCMKPLMAGQTVAGVTVPAGEVQACQAKKAKHEEKKAEKNAAQAPAAAAPAPAAPH